ncbi:MAG: ABC transporter permease [Xanthobacteraceae bacterium]|nr:ABC transporter permease [Xanthobacteraceae bacterium]MCW5675434.1 ABC transporter permease [Xanthobacteraceae bacterium]
MKISVTSIFAFIIYAIIIAPVLMVVGASFTETRFIAFPPQGFTLDWYWRALNDRALMGGLWLSVTIALTAVGISTVLGTMAAIYLARPKAFGGAVLSSFFLAPLNVPAVMTAFALLLAFTRWGLINWYGLVAAHVVLTLPYVVRSVLVSLAGLDSSIQRAAGILGASPLRVFWHVTLPLIRPGVVAGAIFSFLISFNNVPVSVFISSPGSAPLPVVLFNRMQWLAEPSVAAAATIAIVATISTMLILERRFSFYQSMFR